MHEAWFLSAQLKPRFETPHPNCALLGPHTDAAQPIPYQHRPWRLCLCKDFNSRSLLTAPRPHGVEDGRTDTGV